MPMAEVSGSVLAILHVGNAAVADEKEGRSSPALVRHVEMMLWSLSRLADLELAWTFREAVQVQGCPVGRLASGGLLSECETRGEWGDTREADVYLTLAAPGSQVASAAARAAACRLAEAGAVVAALRLLDETAAAAGSLDRAAARAWRAFGGRGSLPVAASLPCVGEHEKEAQLLAHVLSSSPPGDVTAVCEAIESFGIGGLSRPFGGAGGFAPSAGRWLKVAGGEKTAVLGAAARLAPGPRFLEVGAYCGYSALRLALVRPDARILSLEADPCVAVIARCVVAHAGLSHQIDVRIGHSEDVLPKMGRSAGCKIQDSFDLVFFDQRGSRYEADLDVLEENMALNDGAVLVADNVLKPGAPNFLWRVIRGGHFETRVVSLEEYAMPGVEDWMSLSVRRGHPDDGDAGRALPPPPPELRRLEWEADRIRGRAERSPGGVGFAQWAAFVARMREALMKLGLGPGPGAGPSGEPAGRRGAASERQPQ
mmetsp:Transcript_6268/g.23583  ORF Transcript_6268/g.23583 Transcript_6268/m.23583 type:complete len:484 (+) Transcript_6268:292-1743(+)